MKILGIVVYWIVAVIVILLNSCYVTPIIKSCFNSSDIGTIVSWIWCLLLGVFIGIMFNIIFIN